MSSIVIGKHTLESLTSGMYSDPFVVFREYIQNAADSLDAAERAHINPVNEGKIEISLFPLEQCISITDNGLGVPSCSAEKTLISIGNSRKLSDESRGFRGIGRLAALSYCNKLEFETSYPGEGIGTRVVIDAQLLSSLLTATNDNDSSIVDVIKKVYTVEQYPEKEKRHYFNVYLKGVDASSGLMDLNHVITYISQNAPVPYDPSLFDWGQEIVNRLHAENIEIRSYNINVSCGSKSIPVYKPYHNEFLVDKSKGTTDCIKDIRIVQVKSSDGTPLAAGWIGITDYRGSIYDKSIKGLRFRKGNILIGDSQTLNFVFKDPRFNGWSIGEIFVVSSRLIPNARRDNFEKNNGYFDLVEHLTAIASKISRDIRNASLKRNKDLARAIKKSSIAQKDAQRALASGVERNERSSIRQRLSEARETVINTESSNEVDAYYQNIAFDELDMLIGKTAGATSFKAINALENLNSTEKKILEKVFKVLMAQDASHADKFIDAILQAF